MSVTKYYRQAWCRQRFASAVTLFHEARKRSENRDIPLANLARQCANTIFAANVESIVGDRETCARLFMKICREGFGAEIDKALSKLPEKEEIAA